MNYEYCCCGGKAQYAEAFRFAAGDAGEGNLYISRVSWSQGAEYDANIVLANWSVEVPPAATPTGGTIDQPSLGATGVFGEIRVSDQSNTILWACARNPTPSPNRTWSKIDISDISHPVCLGSWQELNDAGGTAYYTTIPFGHEVLSNAPNVLERSCYGEDVIYFWAGDPGLRWVDPENFVWTANAYIQTNHADYDIIGITRGWPCGAVVLRNEQTSTEVVDIGGGDMRTAVLEQVVEVGVIPLPTTAPTSYPLTLDVADFEAELTRTYTNGETTNFNKYDAGLTITSAANAVEVYEYDDGPKGLVYSVYAAEDKEVFASNNLTSFTWRVTYPWGYLAKGAPGSTTNEDLEYIAIWPDGEGHAFCLNEGGGTTGSGYDGFRVDVSSGSVTKSWQPFQYNDFLASLTNYRVVFAPCETAEADGVASLRMYVLGTANAWAETFERANEWKVNRPSISSSQSSISTASWISFQTPWGEDDDPDNQYGLPAYRIDNFKATEVALDSQLDPLSINEFPNGIGDVSTIDGDPWIPTHEWVYTQPDDPIAFIGSVSSNSADGNHTIITPNYVIDTDTCLLICYSLGNATLISPLPGGHSWGAAKASAVSASGPRLYVYAVEGPASGDVLSVKLSAQTEPSVVVMAVFRNSEDAPGSSPIVFASDLDEHPMTIPAVANDAYTFLIHGCLAYGDGGDFSVEPSGTTLVEVDAGLAHGTAPEELHAICKLLTVVGDSTSTEITYEHDDADTLIGFQLAVEHRV